MGRGTASRMSHPFPSREGAGDRIIRVDGGPFRRDNRRASSHGLRLVPAALGRTRVPRIAVHRPSPSRVASFVAALIVALTVLALLPVVVSAHVALVAATPVPGSTIGQP